MVDIKNITSEEHIWKDWKAMEVRFQMLSYIMINQSPSTKDKTKIKGVLTKKEIRSWLKRNVKFINDVKILIKNTYNLITEEDIPL